MLDEVLQRLIVERRETMTEEGCRVVRDNRADELVARDLPAKDRTAPDVGGQRHRHDVGRAAIHAVAVVCCALRRLREVEEKRRNRRLSTAGIFVQNPRHVEHEPAAIRRRVDRKRLRKRRDSARHPDVLGNRTGGRGRRGKSRYNQEQPRTHDSKPRAFHSAPL